MGASLDPHCSEQSNTSQIMKANRVTRPAVQIEKSVNGRKRPGNGQSYTKQRLLDAALKVFAKNGFHGASIREICKCAGTNLATINYHFRGKDNLYRAVIECAIQALHTQISAGGVRLGEKSLTYRRCKGTQPFSVRFTWFDDSKWPILIVFRELIEKGPAFNCVAVALRTRAIQLQEPLRKLLAVHTEPEQVQWCALNLVCQYLYWGALQQTFHRLCPKLMRHSLLKQFVPQPTATIWKIKKHIITI